MLTDQALSSHSEYRYKRKVERSWADGPRYNQGGQCRRKVGLKSRGNQRLFVPTGPLKVARCGWFSIQLSLICSFCLRLDRETREIGRWWKLRDDLARDAARSRRPAFGDGSRSLPVHGHCQRPC
ncbi:hypothetical protein BC567DRAFT_293694 [Phyllosticta citribraziliensis]